MNLIIDLINFKKRYERDLSIEEYFLLVLCVQFPEQIPNIVCNFKEKFVSLQTLGMVKILEDSVEIRQKGLDILDFKKDINFDEFWDAFPVSTPSGRILRSANKVWSETLTRDYIICKKKYLSKVKTVSTHNTIVKIIKGRVLSGEYEYINNMETYINQEKWQQDVKYHKFAATGTNSQMI